MTRQRSWGRNSKVLERLQTTLRKEIEKCDGIENSLEILEFLGESFPFIFIIKWKSWDKKISIYHWSLWWLILAGGWEFLKFMYESVLYLYCAHLLFWKPIYSSDLGWTRRADYQINFLFVFLSWLFGSILERHALWFDFRIIN